MALPQDFHDLAKKVNNWARWGKADEVGTINLITADVVRRAAACAKTGKTFSLALPLSLDGPQSGDIVLLRTGQMQLLKGGDKVAYGVPSSGPSLQTVEWFHNHDVAAVATDNLTFEVFPPEREDLMLPVHLLHLVEMGMTQGQNWDLDELADDCASDGVFEFLLDATPQPFVGGVG